MLITRFLFDLQRVNQRGHAVNFDTDGHVSQLSEVAVSPHTLRFRGMFNSLGSVLVWEEDESTDDDMAYDAAH